MKAQPLASRCLRVILTLVLFSIAGYAAHAQITVLAPNGGEAFTSGSKIPILWTGNDTNRVTLEYSIDSGATWRPIAQHIRGSRYLWEVPPVSVEVEYWMVRVTVEGKAALQEYRRFTGNGNSNAVEFSNDGRLLASAGGADHTLNLWNIATSQKLHSMTLPSSIGWIEFSPDDQEIAVCSHHKNAFVFSTATGDTIKELQVPGNDSWSARYNDEGTKLVTGQLNGSVTVWDRATWQADYTSTKHIGIVRCAEFSHNGKWIGTASADTYCKILDATTGDTVRVLRGHTALANCIDFSPNDSLAVSAGYDKRLKIWNTVTGQAIATQTVGAEMSGVRYSPDGLFIGSASYEGELALRNPTTGAVVVAVKPNLGIGVGVAFSPDGQYVAGSFGNNVAIIWRIMTVSGSSNGLFSVTDCVTKPQAGVERRSEMTGPQRMDLRNN